MAKPKSKNKEDIAAKKREREKQRYQKIKNNPELYAEYQRKNKLKYEKRKEQKKIVPINEMTSRQQRMQRKKWREERNRRYQRMKDKKAKEKQFIAENSPPESDAEVAQLLNAPEGNAEVDIQNVQPGGPRSLRSQPLTLSPSSSRISSACSSGTVSPKAQRIIRKLRYKKDREILSLRMQLEAVKKLNEAYKKRQLRQFQTSSPSDQPTINQPIPEPPQQNNIASEILQEEYCSERKSNEDLGVSDLEVASGIVESYKNLKSNKDKSLFAKSLNTCVTDTISKSKGKLKSNLKNILRKRQKPLKGVKVQQKIKDIKEFLEDDENSSNSAGKKEYVKRGGKKMQKRYLNDSLYNLHKKFIRSCGYSLSFASFCRFRPFWIVQASKRPLENCLCATHENFRLLVSALYKYKMISCKSPAEVLQQICCDPLNTLCLLKKCDGCK